MSSAVAELRARGVESLCEDSRQASPTCAFVALPPASPGARDGADFAAAALALGAPLVLGEGPLPQGVTPEQWLRCADLRRAYPALAAGLAGDPSRQMDVVGVTGTDGKTTVSWLVSELLSAVDGEPCGRVGTLGARWGEQSAQPGFTTPPAAILQPLFAAMLADGVRTVVIEVSSHAIALARVAGVHFRAGVLTTLGRDHLDFHGDLATYHQTKLGFLDGLPAGTPRVVPAALAERLENRDLVTVGPQPAANLVLRSAAPAEDGGTTVCFAEGRDEVRGSTPLVGDLMIANLATAIALGRALGRPLDALLAAAAALRPVPGRFEAVGVQCVVDYAHTPEALEAALASLRPHTAGRLIVVFGAGGDRDRGKRPLLARAALAGADLAVVTTDNPRGEDPGAILDAVCAGLDTPALHADELASAARGWARLDDRRLAIRSAIFAAGPSDRVLIAGKGAETHQTVADRRLPFDDRVEVRAALELRRC